MRRWTFRILICLVLGVVTTVGVAWGLAYFVTSSSMLHYPTVAAHSDDGWDWVVQTFESVGARAVASSWHAYDVAARARWDAEHGSMNSVEPEPAEVLRRFEVRAIQPRTAQTISSRGWPMLALCTFDNDFQDLRLPRRPIFPGFIINTLFYAAIWFSLLFGLAATRRTIRRRRGRCPKCGYDLRGDFDNGCSECGWGREGDSQP